MGAIPLIHQFSLVKRLFPVIAVCCLKDLDANTEEARKRERRVADQECGLECLEKAIRKNCLVV